MSDDDGRATAAAPPFALGLRAPIVQAPLGSADNARLAAAVSDAGGLGTLSLHAPSAESVRRKLISLRRRTTRPVAVALTAEWERDAVVDACLGAGITLFQVFWWNGPRLTPRLHRHGARVMWQVGTQGQIDEALDHGADFLVCQGTEAGGQVRSPHPLLELLEIAASAAGRWAPRIASGGLATRNDVRQVLDAGAIAAQLGTRFLLSEEASVPARHQRRLLRADAADLYLDPALVGDWPCSPRRRLPSAVHDDVPTLFAGLGVGNIDQILPAATIVRRLNPNRSR